MKRFGICVAVLALAAVVPLAAAAALIVPVSQLYGVSAMVDPNGAAGPITDTKSSSTPGTLSASSYAAHPTFPGFVASATITQTSLITDSRIYITWFGTNYRYGYGDAVGSEGHVDVVFDLSVPSTFTYWDGYSGVGLFTRSLTDSSGSQVPYGQLPAGRYRLTADVIGASFATSGPEGSINNWLDLTFTPIPEPGTALLVVFGLGALAARRERPAR
ncbi:MAG TPA: PEP-CTERM sorting domain-containing protein [Myxococcota bacterium]|jgi:hypothetical protein|nr:PEP-CTERM sorting domain-containing protein [Myxococcota bacterium]